MFILTILGLLIGAFAIHTFTQWFNTFTQKEGNYQFFSSDHTIAFVSAYILMFVGYQLMANNWMGDPLNGEIILLVGVIVFIITIWNNFQKTNFLLALLGSLVQIIIYIPYAIVGLLVLIAVIAFFAQTKPVYNINSGE
ncbi:MAG: hypothetical protein PHX13_11355 [Thiovulaceae bacterium]|nr:hypothetical protein [Sulfurimonadaceae bacterium]